MSQGLSGLRHEGILIVKLFTERVIFMKTRVSVVLAVAISLTGIAQTFCECGCGGLADLVPTEAPEPACPLCGDGYPNPTPNDRPETCNCGTCGVIETVAITPATSVLCTEDVGSVSLAQASFPTEPAPVPSAGVCGGEEPLGHFTGSQCALTILLGHLLL